MPPIPAPASQAPPVLEVKDLTKSYGNHVAVHPMCFCVRPKQIVGLLGVNGAGKTTTINMILGVLQPSGGAIRVAGIDMATNRVKALGQMNFAAVYAPLPGNLTVEQNLRVFGMLYNIPSLGVRIEQLLEEFNLRRLRHTKCGVLSSGEQTRASLAKAFLNKPRLLLLDEPTASLDPATAQDVRHKIRAFADQGTGGVLWTSHNMAEVERVCDEVLIVARGRIIMQGTPKGLVQSNQKVSLEELFVDLAHADAAATATAASYSIDDTSV